MRQRLALRALVLLACMLASSAHAERSVVLVTNAECQIDSLSMLEVRKAYFGLAVSFDRQPIRAFRLNNDEELNQVFFQAVVAMSERSYERRLLSLLLKYGSPRPQEFYEVRELARAVRRSNCGIGYMWLDDVAAEQGLRSIRLLWQGD